MSKARAQRRALREAEAERARAHRQAQVARAARGRRFARFVTAPGRAARAGMRTILRRNHSSALGRARARQNGILLSAALVLHLLLWLYQPSWWIRGGAAVLTLLAWPVLIVLIFDRRTTR